MKNKKVNPKTNEIIKVVKGNCSICERNKSQFFTTKMKKQTKLNKRQNFKNV